MFLQIIGDAILTGPDVIYSPSHGRMIPRDGSGVVLVYIMTGLEGRRKLVTVPYSLDTSMHDKVSTLTNLIDFI